MQRSVVFFFFNFATSNRQFSDVDEILFSFSLHSTRGWRNLSCGV